jgi:hypothetical protein
MSCRSGCDVSWRNGSGCDVSWRNGASRGTNDTAPPSDLSDNDILGRLVALNQQRARGRERHRPLGAAGLPNPTLRHGGTAGEAHAAPAAGPKPAFPSGEVVQTAAVMAALAAEPAPLDAASLAGRFREGRRAAIKVGSVLGA